MAAAAVVVVAELQQQAAAAFMPTGNTPKSGEERHPTINNGAAAQATLCGQSGNTGPDPGWLAGWLSLPDRSSRRSLAAAPKQVVREQPGKEGRGHHGKHTVDGTQKKNTRMQLRLTV